MEAFSHEAISNRYSRIKQRLNSPGHGVDARTLQRGVNELACPERAAAQTSGQRSVWLRSGQGVSDFMSVDIAAVYFPPSFRKCLFIATETRQLDQ